MILKRFWSRKRVELPERSLDEIKQICRILFVDDKDFDVVDILKRNGWNNVRKINDIETIDSQDVKDNHIFFVDIQGVGVKLRFKDEGLGLVKALKEKYPEKKVIIYSAIPKWDIFHDSLSLVDARLSKNADPYEFQVLVDNFSKEAFSLNECIDRLKKIAKQELGVDLNTEDVKKKVLKIYSKKEKSTQKIGEQFGIKDAGALASVIRLFLYLNQ